MKKKLLTVFIFFIIPFSVTAEKINEKITMREIQSNLINKDIVIVGRIANSKLDNWSRIHGNSINEAGGYSIDILNRVPSEFLGKKGTIIAVDEIHTKKSPAIMIGEKDAFGSLIDPLKTIDPYFQIIVKIEGETPYLIGASSYYSILGTSLKFPDQVKLLKEDVESHISRLIGKNIYKVGYTEIISPNLTIEELFDYNIRTKSFIKTIDNLTPMKIVDAKVIGSAEAVIIKIECKDGQSGILFGSLDDYYNESYKKTFLEKINISAIEKIPKKFTAREISSIKEKSYFRGMSEDALYITLGFPDSVNNWGRGGEQLIYGKNTYIYLNNKVVTDWQAKE